MDHVTGAYKEETERVKTNQNSTPLEGGRQ
jgi:hypothetical protein